MGLLKKNPLLPQQVSFLLQSAELETRPALGALGLPSEDRRVLGANTAENVGFILKERQPGLSLSCLHPSKQELAWE